MIRTLVSNSIWRTFFLGLVMFLLGVLPFLAVALNVLADYRAGKAIALVFARAETWRWLTLSISLFFGAGLLIWAAILAWNPQSHRIMRRLAVYGPPFRVAAAIDAELENKVEVVTIGEPHRSLRRCSRVHPQVFISRSWVVQPADFGIRVVHLDDVIFVRRGFDSNPLSQVDHFVEVKSRSGADQRFSVAKVDARRLLVELFTRLPWVMNGFDPQREQQWQTNHDQITQQAQRNREQIQALSPEARRALVDHKIQRANDGTP